MAEKRERGCSSTVLRSLVVLVVVAVCPAMAPAEDLSLSQLPAAVRATIERETKGFVIEDIDRDRDDGKIVYEVEAESPDRRRNEMKVAQDGSLVEKREQLRGEDLPPEISEAVRKTAGEMVFFRINRKVSPDGTTRYEIIGDTVDKEINLVLDGKGAVLQKQIRSIDRTKVRGDSGLGGGRELLIKLRGQLKIAAVGDSRGMHGINPWYFLGEQNKKYPMAINFSSSGAGLGRCVAIIEDYLKLAPNLEWVVYGISPRIFNKYYEGWGEEAVRNGSSVYRTDRLGWGVWQQPTDKALVPRSELKGDTSRFLGYEVKDAVRNDDYADEDDKRDARKRLRRGRYEFDQKRLRLFEHMVAVLAKRKVKLLAFTPPIHPVSAGQPCTDDDGTTREAYDELVAKMRALEKKYPNFHFVDINNKGEHRFAGTDFDDFDHLNDQGAKKLTLLLNDIIKSIDATGKYEKPHAGID